MDKYEIIYRHLDMPPEYRGYTIKIAHDKKNAIGNLCPSKPTKDGYGTTKKGARIQILEVNQIPWEKE